MGQRYLAKRGDQWQFYRRVPTDIMGEIGCRFWRESLRTDSRSLAEQRVIAHIHRTNLLIAQARSGTLADPTVREFAYRWRWSGLDLGYYEDEEQLREMVVESLRKHVEAQKLRVRRPEDWDRLIDQCLAELDDGDPEDGPVEVRDRERANELNLTKVFERYAGEKKDELGGRTLREWSTAVQRFVSLHGDMPILSITRSHIDRYQQALRRLPARPADAVRKLGVADQIKWAEAREHHLLSPASVAKNMTAMKSILDFASNRTALIPDEVRATWRNPCEGFVGQGKKVRRPRKRKPFEPEHIPFLFEPVSYRDATKGIPSRFWLPLMLHYTGARLTEIAQATLNDVHVSEDMVYIEVHDEPDPDVPGDWKAIKNEASRRSIPLHEDLIRLGFTGHYRRLRDAGHVRLFPELPHEKREDRALDVSKWFGRYRTQRALSSDFVLHSFRHSFNLLAQRTGEVKEALARMVQGHHLPDVASSVYGSHARQDPRTLKTQVLDRMEFPEIELHALSEIVDELRIEPVSGVRSIRN